MTSAGFCVHCGKPYEAGMMFCRECGQKLPDGSALTGMPAPPPYSEPVSPYGTPPYPPPPPAQQEVRQPFPPPQGAAPPYAGQPYSFQQSAATPIQTKKSAGIPAWGIALMILVPVAVVLVLFWQPLLAVFNGGSAGGAAQASSDAAGRQTPAASLPAASSIVAADKPEVPAAVTQTDDATGTRDDGDVADDSKQNHPELISPLFSQAELTGFYEFFVEVTETSENGSPVNDPDNPVGTTKNMFVFLSMEDDNKAGVHFHRKHEAEGEPSFLVAVISGDEVHFYDLSKGTEAVRIYQGRLMDDQDKIVLQGTFEQVSGDAEDSNRVMGNWRMVSMSDTVFEGVDVTLADKDLDVNEPKGTFTGSLTYTDFINLDNVEFLDETVKRRLKGLHNVPMNTTLTFVGDSLELVIQDPEGETTVFEDFWPIEVYEGHVFTKTFEEVRNSRYLGGVLYRDGDQLRFEGRYSHLMLEEGEFVYLMMRIEAEKPLP